MKVKKVKIKKASVGKVPFGTIKVPDTKQDTFLVPILPNTDQET